MKIAFAGFVEVNTRKTSDREFTANTQAKRYALNEDDRTLVQITLLTAIKKNGV